MKKENNKSTLLFGVYIENVDELFKGTGEQKLRLRIDSNDLFTSGLKEDLVVLLQDIAATMLSDQREVINIIRNLNEEE